MYPKAVRQRELCGERLDITVFRLFNSESFSLTDFNCLTHLTLTHLELCACPNLEDAPEFVTTALCAMYMLKVLQIEKWTWLSPLQVGQVLHSCNYLISFHFTPRWVRQAELWVDLYREHIKHVLSGKEVVSMYLIVAFIFTSAHYLDMVSRKPHLHWSSVDFPSAEDESDRELSV